MGMPSIDDYVGQITLRTKLIIQAQKTVNVASGRFEEDGKYAFEIYFIIRERYRPLISSNDLYDTAEEAKDVGLSLVERVKSLDLDAERDEIVNIIGPKVVGLVGKVIEMAGEEPDNTQ